MKNTQLLKVLILIVTFGSLATPDLTARNETRLNNDTTEALPFQMQKSVNLSLTPSFLDEFPVETPLEINPYLKEPSVFKTFSPKKESINTAKPILDLKKFHKDDALNGLENSIQDHLMEFLNTELIYRDYFKIPLNLSKN